MNNTSPKTELEWFDTLPSHLQYAARQAWFEHQNEHNLSSETFDSLGEALENSFVWDDYGFWVNVIEEYDPEYYRLKALKEESESVETETYTCSMDKAVIFLSGTAKELYDYIIEYNVPEPLVTFQNGYLKFHNGSMMKCYKNTVERVTSYKSDYKSENQFVLMITTTNRDLTSFTVQYPTQEKLDQALSELSEIIIKINEPKE